VRVQMPESEVGDLIVEVRSATAGVGSFTAKFNKFGVSGQLKGRYDDVTKHVVGDFTATAPGKNVIGTFDFQRIH